MYKISIILYSVIVSFLMTSCSDSIDWNADYNKENAQPYGAKSLYLLMPNMLDSAFKDLETGDKTLTNAIPEYIRDSIWQLDFGDLDALDGEDIKPFNIFIVKEYIHLSKTDVYALEIAMRNGAYVTLAADGFNENITNVFDFNIQNDVFDGEETDLKKFKKTKVTWQLQDSSQSYQVRASAVSSKLFDYDLDYKQILGDQSDQVLAIRKKVGRGQLTICAAPRVFTNIHFLYQSPQLVQNFYAKHPKQTTYWANEYYSYDQHFESSDRSLLGFIHKYRSLKWAWYLFILGGILFVLNYMRRVQKPLKSLDSKSNKTLDFIRTLAMLYRKSSSNHEILCKKIDMFNGALYERYDIKKQLSVEMKAQQLHQKSRFNTTEMQLFYTLQKIDAAYQSTSVSDAAYKEIFKEIETIKKNYLV